MLPDAGVYLRDGSDCLLDGVHLHGFDVLRDFVAPHLFEEFVGVVDGKASTLGALHQMQRLDVLLLLDAHHPLQLVLLSLVQEALTQVVRSLPFHDAIRDQVHLQPALVLAHLLSER